MAEYHVENFGCRASRADGATIASGLRGAGMSEADTVAAANVIVLNTCSVTAEADRSARAYLRRVRRTNPEARVIVTGCYAQRVPQEVAALSGVDAVVGNSHKGRVVEAATAMLSAPVTLAGRSGGNFLPLGSLGRGNEVSEPVSPTIWHDPLFAHADLSALPFAADGRQTRPNLKIQDGCGNRCSFCIIPVTRGPSRSTGMGECLQAVRRFVEEGGKELVLSGINLGRWGRELLPRRRLEELVWSILEGTALPRLRISSVEPMDWSAELIAIFRQYGAPAGGKAIRLARHAHLPLQSGSDAILRAMHRRYRPWHYAAKIAEIQAAVPDAAIGADVMIGFPGESEACFRETYDLIEELPLTYLHVFPFSARPGTAASRLHATSPVAGEAVVERKAALRELIAGKNRAFRERFVGVELGVVSLAGSLSQANAGCTECLSDNYLKVLLSGFHPANRLLRARVTGLAADGLRGEPVPASQAG